MDKFVFKSIKTRLIFWFLFIALIPLLIALVVTYSQRVSVIEARTFDKLTAIRDLKAQQLDQWITERLGDAYVINGDYEIRSLENILEKKLKSTDDIEKLSIGLELLKRNLRHYSSYNEIFIIGASSGLVELSTNPGLLGESKTLNPQYTIPLETGEYYIEDIHLSPIKKIPEMTIATPIFCMSHGTHIIGILVARIDLNNSLYKLLLNRVGLGETGETLIVNKDAVALNELRWYEDAPLNLKISAKPAVKASQGETGISITKDYRAEEVLAAYTYISETGWGFVCKQDVYELNAPIRSMLRQFVILFFISALIIYLLAFLIGKALSKPIIELNDLAKKIKTGDLSARSAIKSQDEIGSLAESVNEMTGSIENIVFIQNNVKEVAETLPRQTTMQDFGFALLKQLTEITASNICAFFVLNELNSEFEPVIAIGVDTDLLKPVKSESYESEFGRILSKKRIKYVRDIPENCTFKFIPIAGNTTAKEIFIVPILIENTVAAIMVIMNNQKFSKDSYNILEKSWLNINASYSSLIANERTRILAENLSKTNQYLESQTEKLQTQTTAVQSTSNKLKVANKELEAFAYSVSHDLRAPLRAIVGFTNILMEEYVAKLDDEGKRLGTVIQSNAQKMGRLIDDLLAFSRMGKSSMNVSEIDMKNMVKAIYHEASSTEERKRTDLHIADLPNATGDPNMMRQVWMNLLSNALKFSSKRKKMIISVTSEEVRDKIIFSVKDNGAGFDTKYKDKLFNVFQRLHNEEEFKGTGVGLALVQRIIQRHGGEVWADGQLEKGATFSFSLPKHNN